MSSDSTVATIRHDLGESIRPLVPAEWIIVENLSAARKLKVPGLYFEFTTISAEQDGQPLPRGLVVADFSLVIVTPLTDLVKGEDDVDGAVLDLIIALDEAPNVYWGPTAKKDRLDTGELLWRVPIAVLARSAHTTPESEA